MQAQGVNQTLECKSNDGVVQFSIAESLVNGAYDHSGSVLTYKGTPYQIGKSSTGYDENVGERNIATLFAVSVPGSSPEVTVTIEVPRAGQSLALKPNAATKIYVNDDLKIASCQAL